MSYEPAAENRPEEQKKVQKKKAIVPDTARDKLRNSAGTVGYEEASAMLSPSSKPLSPVQAKGSNVQKKNIHNVAAEGVKDSGGSLPHAHAIQEAFGQHDVSGIDAHVGGAAAEANKAMGAEAYASGNSVAFKNAPDLHTAAHEAAHIVQQRSGVSLSDGVGKAGDSYEQHADAVADAVVKGQSAELMLSSMAGAPAAASGAVQNKELQFLGKRLDEELGEGDAKPEYGETAGKQRRYSREQYIAMWEKEQGREMTPTEKRTIERGCIGITATNLQGGGNPLNNAEALYGTFDQGHAAMVEKNKVRDGMRERGALAGNTSARYVLFAKLFWSNQNPDYRERVKPDEDAYKPDPVTGEVDMTGYEYRARVKADLTGGYVNFDYGFWDDASHCFWHANHMEYKDPEKQKTDPMKVLQSTREKFVKGYFDFDRVVFGIALAENYDAGLAAISNVASGGG
jgi:hypothetical protein